MKLLSLFRKSRLKKYREYSGQSGTQAPQRAPYKFEDHVPMHALDSMMNKLNRNFRAEGILDHESSVPLEEGKKRFTREFESVAKEVQDLFSGCNRKFSLLKVDLDNRLKEFEFLRFLDTYLATNEEYLSEKRVIEKRIQQCRTQISSDETRLKLMQLSKSALRSQYYGGAWVMPAFHGKTWVYISTVAALNILGEVPINFPAIQEATGDMDLLCISLTLVLSLLIGSLCHFLGSSIYYRIRKEIYFLGGLLVMILSGIGILRVIGSHSFLFTALGFIVAAFATFYSYFYTPYSLENSIQKITEKILTSKEEIVSSEAELGALKLKHTKLAEEEFSSQKIELEKEILNLEGIMLQNSTSLAGYLDNIQSKKGAALDSYESGYNASEKFTPPQHRFRFNGSAAILFLALLCGGCEQPPVTMPLKSDVYGLLIDQTDSATVTSKDVVSKLDLDRKDDKHSRKIVISTISEYSVNSIYVFDLNPPLPFPFESKVKRRAAINQWKTSVTNCIDSLLKEARARPLSKIGRAIQGIVDYMKVTGNTQFNLVIASDLLNHQDQLDFYRYKSNPDGLLADSFKLKKHLLNDSPLNLAGVSIHIIGKPPAHLDELIRADHKLWADALTSSGAESVLITAN